MLYEVITDHLCEREGYARGFPGRAFFSESQQKPLGLGRITSYNVCYTKLLRGDFKLPDKRELLMEMKELLTYINLSGGLFSSNHASNYLLLRAWLPEGKQALLASVITSYSIHYTKLYEFIKPSPKYP